jgi:hypothetical protein
MPVILDVVCSGLDVTLVQILLTCAQQVSCDGRGKERRDPLRERFDEDPGASTGLRNTVKRDDTSRFEVMSAYDKLSMIGTNLQHYTTA